MPIESDIRNLINQNGSLRLDELMKQVLSENPNSYYQSQASLGKDGDFITSPEISQIFGEIIGIYFIEQWQKLNCPKKINIVELGPGRGLLMRDLLRSAKLVSDFFNSIEIELVEINQNFIRSQKNNLNKFDLKINWLKQVYDIKKLPTIFIANEFFDALPIKQYIKVKELWYESILIIDPVDGKIKFDKIGLDKELQIQLLQDNPNAYDGSVLEESAESLEIIRYIATHIKEFSGSALIIDYGYYINPLERKRQDYISTLQAIKNHKYCPVLENLGEADLSAHVDFYALEMAAREMDIFPEKVISQSEFLVQNGILLRAESLINKNSQEDGKIISNQVNRLISPNQMGNLFKILKL